MLNPAQATYLKVRLKISIKLRVLLTLLLILYYRLIDLTIEINILENCTSRIKHRKVTYMMQNI